MKRANTTKHRRILAAIAICAIMATLSPQALSYDYNWTGAGANSYWQNPDNWDGAAGTTPSTTNDTATFNTQAQEPQTVRFNDDVAIENLEILNDNLVFDMEGHSLTLNKAFYYIGRDSGETGTLRVVNGEVVYETTVGSKLLYIGYSAGSTGRILLSGEDSKITLTKPMQAHVGSAAGSLGEIILEDGALFTAPDKFYAPSTGTARILVSNATMSAYQLISGRTMAGDGQILLTGPDARWIGSSTLQIAGRGRSEFIVENGAKIQGVAYLLMASENSGTGIMTLTNGSFGVTDAGTANICAATLGALANVGIGEQPTIGGTATLNLWDGSIMKGSPNTKESGEIYFFVGPKARINIRDSRIDWSESSSSTHRKQPFWFYSGSRLNLELTGQSRSYYGDDPIIHSRATRSGRDTNLIDEGAILEVTPHPGYVHEPGAEFKIFKYDGQLDGEFADLPEGEEFYAGEDRHKFRINYGQNGSKVITLTAIAPQGTQFLIR